MNFQSIVDFDMKTLSLWQSSLQLFSICCDVPLSEQKSAFPPKWVCPLLHLFLSCEKEQLQNCKLWKIAPLVHLFPQTASQETGMPDCMEVTGTKAKTTSDAMENQSS